jgi:hypothetical protein
MSGIDERANQVKNQIVQQVMPADQRIAQLQKQVSDQRIVIQQERDRIVSQVQENRAQLEQGRRDLSNQLAEIEGTDVSGKKAKRQKNETMDQIRGILNQIRDNLLELDRQENEALLQLDSADASLLQQEQEVITAIGNQVKEETETLASVHAKIEEERAKAKAGAQEQYRQSNAEVGVSEVSAMVQGLYRGVMGRDATDQELKSWEDRTRERVLAGNNRFSGQEIRAELVVSPEYQQRVSFKQGVIANVRQILTNLPSPLEGEGQGEGENPFVVLASQYGISAEKVVNLTAENIETILAYLEKQSLKFTGSGPQLLVRVLKLTPDQTTQLAADAIIVDILTGVLNPGVMQQHELRLSAYGLGKGVWRIPSPVEGEGQGAGSELKGYAVTMDQLRELLLTSGVSVIAHVRGEHYTQVQKILKGSELPTDVKIISADGAVLAIDLSGEYVEHFEPGIGTNGEMRYTRIEEFLNDWQNEEVPTVGLEEEKGVVLVMDDGSWMMEGGVKESTIHNLSSTIQELSDDQMMKVTGAKWFSKIGELFKKIGDAIGRVLAKAWEFVKNTVKAIVMMPVNLVQALKYSYCK